jgi:hypothetical protein
VAEERPEIILVEVTRPGVARVEGKEAGAHGGRLGGEVALLPVDERPEVELLAVVAVALAAAGERPEF